MYFTVIEPQSDLEKQQIELEKAMMELGKDRFRREERRKEEKGRSENKASSVALTRSYIREVSEFLTDYLKEASEGLPVVRARASHYLSLLDTKRSALIGLRAILRSPDQLLDQLSRHIGQRIEDEIALDEMRSADPALFRRIQKQASKRVAHKNKKLLFTHTFAHELGDVHDPWPNGVKAIVGMKVLEAILARTPLLEIYKKPVKGKKYVRQHCRLTEGVTEWVRNFELHEEIRRPALEPLVVPPRPWTGSWDGGYRSSFIPRLPLVKEVNRCFQEDLASVDLSKVMRAANIAQETPWRVNQEVLEVLTAVYVDGLPVSSKCKVPSSVPAEKPEKPVDIDENEEARREYRSAMRIWHEDNNARISRCLLIDKILSSAHRYRKFDAIYFPYQYDFRGRLYPVTTFSPQSVDYSKGILEFSRGKPLGEEGADWLKVHLATAGDFKKDGVKASKLSLAERCAWTEENEAWIVSIAQDPLADLSWSEADKPWQFLAACFEYARYVEEGPEMISRLPVSVDGTCSGLQHFSLLLRDEVGGAAVNLVPADRPRDIYSRVAERCGELLEADAKDPQKTFRVSGVEHFSSTLAKQWLSFGVDRSVCKRPTMTFGYGSKGYGFADQIMSDTLKDARDSDRWVFGEGSGHHAAIYLSRIMHEAICSTVVKAAEMMDYLQEVSRACTDVGAPALWGTPDGFPVMNRYVKLDHQRVQTWFQGKMKLLSVLSEREELHRVKSANAIAPNFVHSLDAFHLRMVLREAREEDIDLRVVHDSFACHGSDMPRLFVLLRATMIDMYEQHDPLTSFSEQMASLVDHSEDLPDLPEFGRLDIRQVLDSDYTFS